MAFRRGKKKKKKKKIPVISGTFRGQSGHSTPSTFLAAVEKEDEDENQANNDSEICEGKNNNKPSLLHFLTT